MRAYNYSNRVAPRMADVGTRVSSETERVLALAEAVGVLAKEAATFARDLQRDDPRPNPAADRAATLVGESITSLEALCQGPPCPPEAYRHALVAIGAASVALAVAKQAMLDRRHAGTTGALAVG